ncbi:MAG: hypothetical protein QM724_01665 [Flavobacteriales bacterium]
MLAAVALFTACGREPATAPSVPCPVKFTVEPVWNGAPFNKGTVYMNADDKRVQVQTLKFYLAPVTLLGGAQQAEILRADLFDVVNGGATRILQAPAGRYTGLRFGLGLPHDLNHTDITQIDPNTPLGNNSGMYWTWATMYRFTLFEGRFDNDPQASGPLPFQFAYHTGLDTLYRTRTLPVMLEVTPSDTTEIVLQVDVARFFTNGSDTLDLSQGSSFHGEPGLLELGMRIADLERDAFRLP